MSTQVVDPTRFEELSQQRPGEPWHRRPAKFYGWVTFGVFIPVVIVTALFLGTDLPGAVIFVLYLPIQLIASAISATATRGVRGIGDSIIIVNAIGATVFVLIVLLSVLGSLVLRGLGALSAHFIYQNSVYVSPSTPLEYGGMGHALLGTLLIVTIASLLAVPVGVATAVYVTEVRGKAVPYVRFFVQSMSGVPSVVAGLFILTIVVATGAFGQGAFAGGLAYAILMLPTVARTAEEVLRLVPDDLRTGALALGSTRARTVWKVVIPAARTGVITAIILGVARVIGETAPLLVAAGNNDQTVFNPFGTPIASVPTYIFGNVAQPFPDAVTRAWGSALVLIILVGILFTAARIIGRGRLAKSGK